MFKLQRVWKYCGFNEKKRLVFKRLKGVTREKQQYEGWLERLNRSKDGLNPFPSGLLPRISPREVIKQVLEK